MIISRYGPPMNLEIFENKLLPFVATEAADYIIDELMIKCSKRLYARYINDKVPEYACNENIFVNHALVAAEII